MLFAAFVVLLFSLRPKRKTPEELEAFRRKWLSLSGKLSGGEILDVLDDQLTYLYNVRGITYNSSQDISSLENHLPVDRWSIIGGVGVKYDPRNPANSIVVSEAWTGLRKPEKGAASLPRD